MGSDIITSLMETARHPPEDPKLRKDIYNAALALIYEVESAQDTAQRLYHGHVPLAMAQTGNDLGLFKMLSADTGKVWSVECLASNTDADPVLLRRILVCLSAYGMVKQNNDSTFSASNITKSLAEPGAHAGIKHYSLTMTKAYNSIPHFLAQTNYQNPSDSAPFNLAFNTTMPVFEWRKHNPENAKAGQDFMAAQRIGQRSVWDGRVPLVDFHISDQDMRSGRVLVVDIGGGYGHQMVELRRQHPNLQGKMITQDLPFVHDMRPNIDELSSLDIEPAAHDFMQPQPVRGAKVYYLRNVIHNWNDANSKVILQQIRGAMAEDSVIVIDDVVMPKVGATWKQASMDISMMTMLAAMERTEDHFGELLTEAGLKLRDVWNYDEEYGDSLIVAVPI